jgi:hypothetical protein
MGNSLDYQSLQNIEEYKYKDIKDSDEPEKTRNIYNTRPILTIFI